LRTQVLVDRAGMKTIENIDLLPGDILMVQPNTVVPCDCIMIRGDVMVNEASLTGESVPVPKVPLPPNDQLYENSTSNTLFEGTKVV
jgi:cation-transporting ATPase 13A3/4/5